VTQPIARRASFAIPGDLESLTGGYGYDRRVIAELRARGWAIDVLPLDASFPRPTAEARRRAADALARCANGALVVVDGLAYGALADEAERERQRLCLIALVHHPLAHESGLDAATAAALFESERRALACARLVVVTSQRTAQTLAAFDVAAGRIVVIEPGTDPAPAARGSRTGAVSLLTVASVTPRKGYDVLVDALSSVQSSKWRLSCVGRLARDPGHAQEVREAIERAGLTSRITFVGELAGDALAAHYDQADVFVLPTRYEGYGMVVAEALARGLPIVSTRTGAIPELVGVDAGILVDADDRAALAAALFRVIDDRAERERLASGARRVRDRLPTWPGAGERMAAALESVSCDG
jgi:glycosyltransferase involved in cell wall biosynthesis